MLRSRCAAAEISCAVARKPPPQHGHLVRVSRHRVRRLLEPPADRGNLPGYLADHVQVSPNPFTHTNTYVMRLPTVPTRHFSDRIGSGWFNPERAGFGMAERLDGGAARPRELGFEIR